MAGKRNGRRSIEGRRIGEDRTAAARRASGADFLAGGGEMGGRIREHDWPATPLGPVETWPQSLRSAVSILLPSRAQVVLFWGPEFIAIYNDAYAPVFGAKHPWALGRPARECWSEVWEVIGPLFEGVVRTGEAFSNVSHEFRTPLTLMLGPVGELLAKSGDQVSADDRALLTVAQRNGLRLQKLVNTLLDFARIEAGRVQAVYEPTDLAAMTAELASNFRSACERAGLALLVDCPPLPEPVYVDPEMWERGAVGRQCPALRGGAARQIAGRGGKSGQGRVPGHALPRAAHPLERDARVDPHASVRHAR
jgi:hypothetical protein